MPGVSIVACAFAVLLATVGRAQDIWTLTTADFSEIRGAVTALSPAGITFRNAAGETSPLPWSEVLELSRSTERSGAYGGVPDGVWVALLAGGQRLVGGPLSFDDESLTWSTSFGEFVVPVSQLIAICRGSEVARAIADQPDQDTVVLANGDVLAGIVESISPEGVTVANSPQVNWDAVALLKFAGVKGDRRRVAPAEGYLVRIVGGAVLSGRSVELKQSELHLFADDATGRRVPMGSVLSIEHRNGPVAWLTDLAPIELIQKPYFGTAARPIIFNAGLSGEVIRDGDRVARCGIIAMSYTRLTYSVDPAYRAFRVRFAVDGSLPCANAVVRILAGDESAEKTIYEFADLSAATPAQTVVVPLNGAKRITLEVDYGKTFDVQDRVAFIEPAFLKTVPVASTQPSVR